MTLDEATKAFLRHMTDSEPAELAAAARALELLKSYFSGDSPLDKITPTTVRDFLARWYIERAGVIENESSEAVPEFKSLTRWLVRFVRRAAPGSGGSLIESLPVIEELDETVPQAMMITRALSKALAERGGAFSFPEFLTSFEAGGHSEYDIDSPRDVGAREGFFRITRVEDARVEAEEIITGERVWPVIFPQQTAGQVEEGYIINLEIIRTQNGWQISDCGFAYPPGTDV